MKDSLITLIFLIAGIFSAYKFEFYQTGILLSIIISICIFDLIKVNKDIGNFKSVFFKRNIIKFVFFIVVFMYAFISSYLTVNHKNQYATEKLYKKDMYTCKVLDVKKRTQNYKLLIYIYKVKERVELYVSVDDININYILPGDEVVIEGMLMNIEESSNLGEYNEKQNKREKRIFYNFSGKLISFESKNNIFYSFIYKMRMKISTLYDELLNEKESGIIKAMIIGESQFLEDNIKTLYKGAGIYHILAISGLHVSIVAMFVKFILSKLKTNIKLNKYITISTLVFYMVFTGMAVSTIRATIMHVFSEIAEPFDRKYNSSMGLILAAIILLLINPSLLFSISFILSFASVTAIKCKLKLPRILKSQEVNISVFLFMTPLLVYNFYSIQGLSILANIFILPLTSTLVITCFFVLIFNCINSNVVLICGKMISFILIYYENVLTYLSSLSGFDMIVGKIDLIFLILWYMAYFCLYKISWFDKYKLEDKAKKVKYVKYIILIILIAIIYYVCCFNKQKTYVTFCDVEHGDATVIFDSKKESVILIDGGGTSNNTKDVGTYVIYPYLKYEGITKIDLVIISHFDRDHAKALIELMDLIKIENIIISRCASEVELYKQMMQKSKIKNIKVKALSAGDKIKINDIQIEVLYPFYDMNTFDLKENNLSLVTQVRIKDKNILFTGDIENEAEKIILDKVDFENIYILKVPHHGLGSSSNFEFVKKVNPKYAIVSGDKENWKVFKQKNMWKYEQSKILSTYEDGMIRFEIEN